MDFALNDDQRAIQDAARQFAEAELAPHSAEWDETKHFPVDVMRLAAEMGFCGIYTAEEHGGMALGRVEAALIFEELSRGDVSTAAFISIHNMATWMIDSFGSDDLRGRYVPRLTTMELIASYCLTEPGSGSDAAGLRTTAKQDGDHWVLNGSKAFISGAGTSDLYVVMARTGGDGPKGISTFVVEKDTPGLSFGAQEKKMGWNSQPTAIVAFDECRIPAANLLGKEGDGFRYAMMGLDGGRLNIAACSLGGARLALETAQAYVITRKQFGKPIAENQGLQWILADMQKDITAARALVHRAAMVMDAGHPATMDCSIAKCFAGDCAVTHTANAVQVFGGSGYIRGFEVERLYRDAKITQIYEGTNQIQRTIIAREMLKD
jgi:alkylation response protein AidB-like acyl-CoA dehydrogenase